MPRLLLFGPCQKAIIDREDTSISMIAILTGFTVQPPPDVQLTPEAVMPLNWAAVSVWIRETGDENRAFEQRLQIIRPDGAIIGGSETPFTFPKRHHQVAVSGQVFPVGLEGEYTLVLSVREVNTDQWHAVARYPVEVTHGHSEVLQ